MTNEIPGFERLPDRERNPGTWIAVVVTAVLALIIMAPALSLIPVAEPAPLAVADECRAALGYEARTPEDIIWLNQCVHALTPPTPAPTPSATPTPTPQPSPTPTPSPSPTAPVWPGAANTGVPDGTILTAYTGPCTVTVANTVIDAKTVNCTLSIRAANVIITRSRINGRVENGSASNPGRSFTIRDSEVIAAPGNTGVGESFFTVERVEIRGGNRGLHCYQTCTVRDSWIHGNRITSGDHASGARMGMNGTFIHNTIVCDVANDNAGGGCSADLTGYPDFSPIHHNLIENNLFQATTGGFCAYGGATSGKPFSSDPANATFIVFRGNVFQRGQPGNQGLRRCGFWGAITDFAPGRTGNQWVGNTYDDGTPLLP